MKASLLFLFCIIASCGCEKNGVEQTVWKEMGSHTPGTMTEEGKVPPAPSPVIEVSLQGFDLKSTLSEIKLKMGTNFERIDLGDTQQYHWNNSELIVDARGEKILRLSGAEIEVDGQKLSANKETLDSLTRRFGKPSFKFYGPHGEPCYSWSRGLQVGIFGGTKQDAGTFDIFALTSKPATYLTDPFAQSIVNGS